MESFRYDVPKRPPQSGIQEQPIRRRMPRKTETGSLCISGKRFFGQILIDHWVLQIGGQKESIPFGKDKRTLELPAGIYTAQAYTPYLGMHCMAAEAEIEILPGRTTRIAYHTVFDIFKDGMLERLPPQRTARSSTPQRTAGPSTPQRTAGPSTPPP